MVCARTLELLAVTLQLLQGHDRLTLDAVATTARAKSNDQNPWMSLGEAA